MQGVIWTSCLRIFFGGCWSEGVFVFDVHGGGKGCVHFEEEVFLVFRERVGGAGTEVISILLEICFYKFQNLVSVGWVI